MLQITHYRGSHVPFCPPSPVKGKKGQDKKGQNLENYENFHVPFFPSLSLFSEILKRDRKYFWLFCSSMHLKY